MSFWLLPMWVQMLKDRLVPSEGSDVWLGHWHFKLNPGSEVWLVERLLCIWPPCTLHAHLVERVEPVRLGGGQQVEADPEGGDSVQQGGVLEGQGMCSV